MRTGRRAESDSHVVHPVHNGSNPSPGQSKIHESWIDSFRGIAILAVLAIHILPRLFQQCVPRSPLWFALVIAHRACFFAVPGFLMLSAMVNAHSLLRGPDLRRYFRSRAQSVLWPYLVWSAAYLAYRKMDNPAGFHLSSAPALLWYGKSYPHLYFMVLLIQLLLLLPLLAPLVRKRPGGVALAVAALVVTAAAYLTNRLWLHLPSPASVILWYAPAVCFGLAMALRFGEGPRMLRRAAPWAAAAVAICLFWYAPSALDQAMLHHARFDGAVYQVSEWAFTTGMSILAMLAATRVGEGSFRRALGYLGRNSLQIYLAHPLFLALLDDVPHITFRAGVKSAFILLFGIALAAPLLLAESTRRLRLSALLFGR
jgi:surface polysaccharide O-acyltransferase-like enzyme